MFSRIKGSIKTLVVVSLAYLAYSLLLVRFIEPSVTERADGESAILAAGESPRQTQLRSIFPPGSWELDGPKVLETESGMLLLKELKELDEYRLEMKPCTLVFFSGEEQPGSERRPTVLQASESAVLTFEEPLNLARGQIGRLASGLLNGSVTIRSPETAPGAGDSLEILTNDVHLTAEQIEAPGQVKFNYGKNTGQGRHLIITLNPARPRAADKMEQMAIGELRTLELVQVDYIRMRLDNSKRAGNASTAKDKPRLPAQVDIQVTCSGPFVHNFQKKVASFQDDVRVVRSNPDGRDDLLTCSRLSAYFTTRPGKQGAASKNDVAAQSGLSGLEVERIEAVGSPVNLDVPTYDAAVKAEYLEYNFKTKQVRVEDSRTAMLRYEQNELQTPRIDYQFGEEGRLGQLRAAGPGRLLGSLPDDPTKKFEAIWNERVVLQPHQGDHALSLISGAVIRVHDMGEFSAKNLHIWIHENPLPRASAGDKQKYEYQPVRLLAEEDVRIASWPLTGLTQRAEVWIRHEGAAGTARQRGGSKEPKAADVAASQPDATKKDRSRQRFSVAGDHLQCQLIRSDEEVLVEHLIIDKNVRFREIQTDQPGEIPLGISGDIVQVDHANTPRARVRVQGQPAEVAARGMALVGGNIQLNRSDNRMWIVGPGTMTLPASRNAPDGKDGIGGTDGGEPDSMGSGGMLQGLKPAGPVTIAWKERMDFDGLTARFHRDVTVVGKQQSAERNVSDLTVRGDKLSVTLTERVDFTKEKQSPDLNVREMKFDGRVSLRNEGSLGGQRTSIDNMLVNDLTIDGLNGRMLAFGPGWGSTVRYNKESEDGASRLPGDIRGPGPGLIYVRVNFEDQVTGDYDSREVEFSGRVNTIYGPVTRWDQTLDSDPPGGLASGQYLLSSDRMSIVDMGASTQSGPRGIGLQATGDATIEGKAFSARGERISYAKAKELVILEGDGYNDARLWMRGDTTPAASAQQIRYWASTNRIDANGVNQLNLSQVGGSSNR